MQGHLEVIYTYKYVTYIKIVDDYVVVIVAGSIAYNDHVVCDV